MVKIGYTVFVLEEQYSICEKMNDFIQKGIGNPKKIIKQFMVPWKSYEILNLVKWMRQYNMKHDNKLEFKGIDCQYTINNYKRNTKIDKYVYNMNESYNKLDLSNNETKNWKKRDLFMYNIFMKIYDKSKKYFLWFHNYHIRKKKLCLGNYLYEEFKDKYYVIGNGFYKGEILGVDIETKEITTIKIDITKKIKKLNEGINIRENIKDFSKYIIYNTGYLVNKRIHIKNFIWKI